MVAAVITNAAHRLYWGGLALVKLQVGRLLNQCWLSPVVYRLNSWHYKLFLIWSQSLSGECMRMYSTKCKFLAERAIRSNFPSKKLWRQKNLTGVACVGLLMFFIFIILSSSWTSRIIFVVPYQLFTVASQWFRFTSNFFNQKPVFFCKHEIKITPELAHRFDR